MAVAQPRIVVNEPTVFQLAKPVNPGDTSMELTGMPLTGLARSNLAWVLDPYNTKGERASVNGIVGNKASFGTFDQAATPQSVGQHHDAGTNVIVVNAANFTPMLFGARGDWDADEYAALGVSGTDDWAAIQNTYTAAGGIFHVTGGGNTSRRFRCDQPLIETDEMRCRDLDLAFPSSFDTRCAVSGLNGGIGDSQSGRSGVMRQAERGTGFTSVDTTTGVFTVGGVGWSIGRTVILQNPRGTPMPGGIVSGRIYVVHSVIDGTHIKLAEVATPTIPIIPTSTGSGSIWTNFYSNCHVYTDRLNIFVDTPNIDGFQQLQNNQPTRIRDLYVEFGPNATGGGWATVIVQQLSDQTNIVVKLPAGTAPKGGVWLGGVGHVIDTIVVDGQDNPNTVALSMGGNGHTVAKLHSRKCGLGWSVRFDGNSDNNTVRKGTYEPTTSGGLGFVRDTNGLVGDAANWTCGRVDTDGINVPIAVISGEVTYRSGDGVENSGVGAVDDANVFPGVTRPAGLAAKLLERYVKDWSASDGAIFKMRPSHEGVNIIPNAAGAGVWLPPHEPGLEVWVYVAPGANTVTIYSSTGVPLAGQSFATPGKHRYSSHYNVWYAY